MTKSPTLKTYTYWVQVNYLRLAGSRIQEDLPTSWMRLIRQHHKDGVLPMDAARGILATEVEVDA